MEYHGIRLDDFDFYSFLPRHKVHSKSALTLATTLIHISRSLVEIPHRKGGGVPNWTKMGWLTSGLSPPNDQRNHHSSLLKSNLREDWLWSWTTSWFSMGKVACDIPASSRDANQRQHGWMMKGYSMRWAPTLSKSLTSFSKMHLFPRNNKN